MIEKRTFDSLGKFDADWLAARYHFSFRLFAKIPAGLPIVLFLLRCRHTLGRWIARRKAVS